MTASEATGTIDVDALPPTQYLVMDVLAARARLGEGLWTFPTALGQPLAALNRAGLIEYKSGVIHGTYMAWLTDTGRAAVLSETYTTPTDRSRQDCAEELRAELDRISVKERLGNPRMRDLEHVSHTARLVAAGQLRALADRWDQP